jgi:hypothetical protein
MARIHKDSASAWADLQKRGGIELDGRDEGFEEELKNRLAPTARSLDEALQSATTDDLVRAFFDVIQPYVAMFRAILEFFEKAGATEGRAQWDIMVDDVDVSLEHFRRFLKEWNSIPCEIEVPAVDYSGIWTFTDLTRNVPEMANVHSGVRTKNPYLSGVADIDSWLKRYRDGDGFYEEWPKSLTPRSLGPGYSDVAALAIAVLQTIRGGYESRKALIEALRRPGSPPDRVNALSPGTIAQNETDFWLGTMVARLARSLTLPPDLRKELGERLKERFAQYPRKKFGARLKIADLRSYLSLPLWQKRHELYAVWIATEIVNALPDHNCEIHHDGGKIVFAFRETVVATVKSAWPPVRIMSERRVPLTAPVGKGRSGNVQPDYGLWRQEGGVDTCGLVVEVKHYKRSATSSFSDVLTDYSRAFPKAEVYLVNHGPIGDATSNVPRELLGRCHTIRDLIVPHLSAREELRNAVRKYVGKPVAWAAKSQSGGSTDTILAVDVSASMSGSQRRPEFSELLGEILDNRCASAALIDVSVRNVVPLEELSEAMGAIDGGSTGLYAPVEELLGTFKRVLVITDNDGLNSLAHFSKKSTIATRGGFFAIEVLAD